MKDVDNKNLLEEQTEEQPKFARSLTEKIKESKKAPKRQEQQTAAAAEFDIRMFPWNYRTMLKGMVDDLNKIYMSNF